MQSQRPSVREVARHPLEAQAAFFAHSSPRFPYKGSYSEAFDSKLGIPAAQILSTVTL